MFIHEATEKAINKNAYITHPDFQGKFKLKPTNEPECCIVYELNGAFIANRWQPYASDLVSDKWQVVE